MSPRTSATAAPTPTAAGRDWRSGAACRGVAEPDLFFPEVDRGQQFEAQVAAAKRVCAGCLVRADCLGFAVGALGFGVAGGLTAEERRGLPRVTGQIADAGPLGSAWMPLDAHRPADPAVDAAGGAR